VSEQFQNASVPFSVDCLIFNFTEKQRWMERQLNEAVQRCGETSYLPTRPIALWRSEDYKLILKTLAVDVSDIEKKLGNRRKDDVNDKGVIFFTGWRAFTPLYKDCGNPSWWAWHPFLLHPYLTPEAAEWLADRNVRVVGTDAVSVDSLVRQWLLAGELCPDLEAPWKEIREAVAAWKRNEEKNLSHRGYMKVHRTMINSGALIIESLALTSAVLLLGDESGLPHIGKNGIQLPEVASARITVLPFVSEKGLNALPVYAILFPPERPQS
jgi:kynurenine formamidase